MTIGKDSDSEKKPEMVEKEAEPAEIPEKGSSEGIDNINVSEFEAFYGVWCGAKENEAEAEKLALKLRNLGFEGEIFVTTDWENLNTEKFYVVTAGICETKQEAEQLLDEVKENGYSDAYVKYTGKRK